MPTSLGPAEIMVILIVALIVLGPKRLPEAGRQVGKAIAEVRKWSQGFQDEIRSVVNPENSPPSYSQPQPGYDPPPIPIVPAETAPPPAVDTSPPPVETNGISAPVSAGRIAGPAPIPIMPAETAPPSTVDAAPLAAGTGSVDAEPAAAPAGAQAQADSEPFEPSGPPAGESPRS